MTWIILAGLGGIVIGSGLLVTLIRSELPDDQVTAILSGVLIVLVGIVGVVAWAAA